MKFPDIINSTKTANPHEIYLHLKECNNDFIPPLSDNVELTTYAQKIFEHSITFEAWGNRTLIGLIAAYFNNTKELVGFITNVSVIKDYYGYGIATTLMTNCIKYGQSIQYKTIQLEVNTTKFEAINLYKKLGFKDSEYKEKTVIMKLIISNSKIAK